LKRILRVSINNPVITAGLTAHIRNKTPYLTGLEAFLRGVSSITFLINRQKINPRV
jgi:hypothetical protein